MTFGKRNTTHFLFRSNTAHHSEYKKVVAIFNRFYWNSIGWHATSNLIGLFNMRRKWYLNGMLDTATKSLCAPLNGYDYIWLTRKQRKQQTRNEFNRFSRSSQKYNLSHRSLNRKALKSTKKYGQIAGIKMFNTY